MVKICQKKKIKFSCDIQSSSQIGNILKYKNSMLLTPTEHEARLATSDNISGISVLCDKIIKSTLCKNLILKLGADGFVIFTKKNNKIINDALPAFNKDPIDISGAGDSLLAYVNFSLSKDLNIWEASLVGSLAAAIQISRKGNIPVELSEVINLLEVLN